MGVVGTALSTIKNVAFSGGANIAFTGLSAIDEYKTARSEGDSALVATAKAVGDVALFSMLSGPATLAYMGATILPELGLVGGKLSTQAVQEKGYLQRGKFGSGYFDMSEAGYTMRQRSLNAIRQNGLNLQSALGNEARQFYGRY